MKRYTLLLLLSVLSSVIFAQKSTDTINLQVKSIKLDMLKSPTNPAFILMNTSPTEIVEPGSAPEFFTSVQNASNNFSTIPNNFGFSVTPFWWGKKAKRLSFNNDFDTINSFTFYRTASISGGIVHGINNEEELWRYGIGFQSTLLRGSIDNTKKIAYLNKLKEYHEAYYGDINSFFEKYPEYNSLESERNNTILRIKSIDGLFQDRAIDSISAQNKKDELIKYLQEIQNKQDYLRRKLTEKFNKEKKYMESNEELDKKFNDMNERKGLKWDIGGGLSINSNYNKIDSIGIYRAGFWSNFGGNIIKSDSSSSNLAAFILVRYLYYNAINYRKGNNVDLINNLHTLDLGVKIQYEIINKFTFGLETIYRVGLSNSIYESTYKINGLVQYQLGNNRLVYVSLGNNFNDNSNFGPEDLVVTFGLNIGIGGNVDIYDIKFK